MASSTVTDHGTRTRATSLYAYDGFGRRTVVQDGGGTVRTLYDGLSFEVIREGETFRDETFTTRVSQGGTVVENRGTEGSRYRWIGEVESGIRTRTVGEYEEAGERYRGISVTLYGKGEAVSLSTTRGTVYLGKDVLGSVRTTTGVNGSIEDRYEYDVFGVPYQGDLTQGMDLGYTGKPYDAVTGLYDYGYRDYKAEAARFTSIDPIRDGNNWYAYVNNDPVNWVDPWGLEGENILIINMPGLTDPRLESYLFTNEHFNAYSDPDLIGVRSADNGRQLQAILNENRNKAEIIIFAGGHSDKFISPNDFHVYLPNSTNVYFATCEEGLNKQAIANSMGLPASNVHFNNGLSWANNSYEFIRDVVYNNVDQHIAFQAYLDANKDYQMNPEHRMNWTTEKNKGSTCAE
jgi:RHS repeat-associated protein